MPAEAQLPEDAIAVALRRFARTPKLTRVHFAAHGGTTPQPLAYFVHFPRLYVALAGRDAMWLEQAGEARLLRLSAGEAVVVPANCWNRPVGREPSLALNVLFGRKQIGLSLVRQTERHAVPVGKATIPPAAEDAPRSIMHALLAVRDGACNAAVPLVDALLRSILDALTDAPAAPRRRAANLHESICMYVQEHFQSDISRDSVAAHFKVSPNHISRVFKHEGMVSFNAYVSYVRINWAKHLLLQHHQALDEIATLCGYNDTSYFCRSFKERTKLTPSQYRAARSGSGRVSAESR
ncbi:MAG TPA: helix-turn-helix transcriptional regulator [Opitutaceae bacterium]|nr:helix-turn-helix transcriptional regulator [Opitutaceae bacterium]